MDWVATAALLGCLARACHQELDRFVRYGDHEELEMHQAVTVLILTLLSLPAEAGRKVQLGGMPLSTYVNGATGSQDHMKVTLLNPSSKTQTVTIQVKTTGGGDYSVPMALPPGHVAGPGSNVVTTAGTTCEEPVKEVNSFATKGYRICKLTTTLQPESSAVIVFVFSVGCLNLNICTNPYGAPLTLGFGTAFGELSVHENDGYLNGYVTTTTASGASMTSHILGGRAF